MGVAGAPETILDSESYNSGDSFGVGFHTGLMMRLNQNHTRAGINYQSQMKHKFKGYSQLTGRLADPTLNIFDSEAADPMASYRSNNLYSNTAALPAIVTLSIYQDVSKNWALLGSVVYSAWSSFKTINLNNVAVGVPNPDNSGDIILTKLNVSTPENYRDVWRFALGTNYHVNDQWMMRVGGGFDQTPTVGVYRDVRLPDSDRWAVSVGAHYEYRTNIAFDVGYTYLFVTSDAIINNTIPLKEALSSYNVNTRAQNHASLLGLQVVWKFDQKNNMKQ
jgi:long-chain fatty acid transport protein